MAPGADSMWRHTAQEDVGFGTKAIYSSIDEPFPGIRPRQVHVTAAELADKAHEEATRDPSDGPVLESELEGHRGAVTAVSFLPDDGPLVSGGTDGSVRVWNSCALKSALANRKGYVYRGHTDAVTAVDCSSDGSLVASGSKDKTVRLWHPGVDGRTNHGGGVIKGHGGSIRAVNFADDGQSLLTASDDKTIKIWSLPEMRFMHALTGHTHWVRSACFDPGHSQVVVSGGDDKTVRIWHMPRKNPVQTLFGHTGAVNAVAFNPDGFSIASASTDCSVKLWDVRTGRLLQHYEPHGASVNSLYFHPSGDYLASAADDATVCLLDLKEGRVCAELTTLRNMPSLGVAMSARGDRLASACADGTVRLYSTNLTPAEPPPAPLSASAPSFKPSAVPKPLPARPSSAPTLGSPSEQRGLVAKWHLSELKAMSKPPLSVCLLGDAVCILFNVAPSWSNFKSLLAGPTFLSEINDFDQYSIPPKTLWKLQDVELLTMPEFQPDAVMKSSYAAGALCRWVHQMAAAATGYTPTRQARHAPRRPAAANTTAAQSPLPSPKPQPSRPTARKNTSSSSSSSWGGGGPSPLSSPVKVARGEPALFGLSNSAVGEMKAMGKPPAAVKMVAEAVCMLFELPPSWHQFKMLAGNPSKLLRAMKAMLSPEASYPTAEAVAKTAEYVMTCGPAFDPVAVKKASSVAGSFAGWVVAMISGGGFASVPLSAAAPVYGPAPAPAPAPAPVMVRAAPVRAAVPMAAPVAGGEAGMEVLIGATLQRMAEQLDVLTRTVVALDGRLSSVEEAV